MISRLVSADAGEAAELGATLVASGFVADVVEEAGEEGPRHVVQTDAPVELLQELLTGSTAALEVSDPMTGVSAPVPAPEDDPTA